MKAMCAIFMGIFGGIAICLFGWSISSKIDISGNLAAGYERAKTCGQWDFIGSKNESTNYKQELYRCASDKGLYFERSTPVDSEKFDKQLAFLVEIQEENSVKLKRIATAAKGEQTKKRFACPSCSKDSENNGLFEKIWSIPDVKEAN